MRSFLKNTIYLFLVPFSSFLMAADLVNLSPAELQKFQSKNAIVVDIRTEKEWAETGIIPSSHKIEFFSADGQSDPEKWLVNLRQQMKSPDQPIVLVCRSGNRSRMAGDFLTQKMGMTNVYHLEKGIKSWIKEGLNIQKDCPKQIACNQ